MKMTGKFLFDFSDASFSAVYDLIKWSYSGELVKDTGLPVEKFPELQPSTRAVGELLLGTAEELNLIKSILCRPRGI